jgi:NADH-quinone oxidoreductase subunit L
LIILAAVSCVAGFIPFGEFVTWNREEYIIHLDWTVATTSIVVAVCAIALATLMYRKENAIPTRMKNAMKGLWTAAYNRFYFDELYLFITHKIIFNLVSRPIAWFDRQIIDGTMDKFAEVTNKASEAIKGLQSGRVQSYVLVYLLGALLVGVVTVICMVL